MLQIFNSLSKQKEAFKPLSPKRCKLYVCGMTVYDYCHLGHARVFVVFDLVFRFLKHIGYDVTYVRNITDIDDKIIARAEEQGISYRELADRFVEAMEADERALGVLPPTQTPRATEYIEHMQALIGQLMAAGHAYQGESGDVYYAVNTFDAYGALSHQKLEALRTAVRIDESTDKKDALDFVLWKMAKPGEPAWESPWGTGRPGWHIECSAMSLDTLGEQFDLHGGGFDLRFPHHENELAQSEAVTHQKLVQQWMHVGFVNINDEKMSKSLNNFLTIRNLLETHHPEVLRYFLLSGHYRSPINYTEEALSQAKSALKRVYKACAWQTGSGHVLPEWAERFKAALCDDFNTPQAFSVVFDLVRALNTAHDEGQAETVNDLAETLKTMGAVLGLFQATPEAFLSESVDAELVAWVEEQIQARHQARADKNWAEADRIRDALLARGITLEDGADGTRWS